MKNLFSVFMVLFIVISCSEDEGVYNHGPYPGQVPIDRFAGYFVEGTDLVFFFDSAMYMDDSYFSGSGARLEGTPKVVIVSGSFNGWPDSGYPESWQLDRYDHIWILRKPISSFVNGQQFKFRSDGNYDNKGFLQPPSLATNTAWDGVSASGLNLVLHIPSKIITNTDSFAGITNYIEPGFITNDTIIPETVKYYIFDAKAEVQYRLFWEDSGDGTGIKTGDVAVSVLHQDGASIFSQIDNGYSAARKISTLSNERVVIKVQYYTPGTFSLTLATNTIIRLQNGISTNNTLITGDEQWYSFNVVSGEEYVVWWDDSWESGNFGGDVFVTAYHQDRMSQIFSQTSGYSGSPTFIASSNEVVYLKVASQYSGSYSISFSELVYPVLSINSFTNDSFGSASQKWYKFPATAGEVYMISWDDSYQGSGSFTGDIKVSAYRADRITSYFESVDSGYSSPREIVSTVTEDVYLKVTYYSPGTYSIGVFTNDYVPISFNQKTNDSIGSPSQKWYKFAAHAGEQYTIKWEDSVQGSGGYSADITVSAYKADKVTPYFQGVNNGYLTPQRITPSVTEDIFLKVSGYSTGSYAISVFTNVYIPLSPDVWGAGTLNAGDELWYSFDVQAGKFYEIKSDDSKNGTSSYTADIFVSAYMNDRVQTYFMDKDDCYQTPGMFYSSEDGKVYIKVSGYSGSTGTFALKVAEVTNYVSSLNYQIIDAKYSSQLDRIIAISGTPNKLHIFDPVSQTETSVSLSYSPECLSINTNGTHAAVGHDGYISYIDLGTATLIKTVSVPDDVRYILLHDNGNIYYSKASFGGFEGIQRLNIATETVTTGTGSVYSSFPLILSPDGKYIYTMDYGLSPQDIYKFSLTGVESQYLYDSPYHGDYGFGSNLWLSPDGQRIFTSIWNYFSSSVVQASDMLYQGVLSGLPSNWIRDMSFSSDNKIAVLPDSQPVVLIYDYSTLSLQDTKAVPKIVSETTNIMVGYGRFVFHSSDGSRRYIVIQSTLSLQSGTVFGVSSE